MAEPREMEKVVFLFFSMDGMRLVRPPETLKLDSDQKGMYHQGPFLFDSENVEGEARCNWKWSEKSSRVLQKQEATTYHWNHLYKPFETTIS